MSETNISGLPGCKGIDCVRPTGQNVHSSVCVRHEEKSERWLERGGRALTLTRRHVESQKQRWCWREGHAPKTSGVLRLHDSEVDISEEEVHTELSARLLTSIQAAPQTFSHALIQNNVKYCRADVIFFSLGNLLWTLFTPVPLNLKIFDIRQTSDS